MGNGPYAAVVMAVLVLIGVAVWQFYSLARGETLAGPYSADRPGQAVQGDPMGRRTLAVSPR
jgi:hypothetical protein